MRVSRIELTNFRSYEQAAFDFTHPRTLIVGPNGVGKSTIIDAILWAITGRCRGVDGKGQGQKELIRAGADDMAVTVHLDGVGPVLRSISRAGSAQASVKTEALLAKLGTTDAMLTAVAYGHTFFDLHHDTAKKMLLQLLDVRIDPADLPGLNVKEPVDLDGLQAHYDAAFQHRALVKKQLADLHVPDTPKVANIDLAGKDVAGLKSALKDAQAGLARAIHNQAQVKQTADRLEADLKAADQGIAGLDKLKGARGAHQDMLDEHTQHLVDARADLQAAEDLPAEPVAELQNQVKETSVLVDKIQRHVTFVTGTAPAAGSKRKTKIPVADATPHTCILGAGIPCLTPAVEFTNQLATLQAAVASQEARIKAGTERQRRIAAAQQAVKDAERNVAYHQQQVTDATTRIAQADALQQQVPDLRQKLTDAQDALVEAAAAATEQQALVNRLLDQVTVLTGYLAAQDAHQRATRQKADLEQQVADAEALVTLLGPKGVRLKALTDAVGDFEGLINAALDPFGFQLAINADPWRVEVQTPDTGGKALPFTLLSKGQQLWTALAFQAALAAVSGLDFFALDDVEGVVGDHLALVTQAVMGLPVGQVLVSMAKGDDDPVPEIEGLQVVRLQAVTAAVA